MRHGAHTCLKARRAAHLVASFSRVSLLARNSSVFSSLAFPHSLCLCLAPPFHFLPRGMGEAAGFPAERRPCCLQPLGLQVLKLTARASQPPKQHKRRPRGGLCSGLSRASRSPAPPRCPPTAQGRGPPPNLILAQPCHGCCTPEPGI